MALTQNNNHTFTNGELVTSTKLNSTKVVQSDNATVNQAFVGNAGQLTYDETNDVLRVHDGSTAGGKKLVSTSSSDNIATTGNITAGGTLDVESNITTRANMQVTRGSEGPGFRLVYDNSSDPALTRDLYVDNTGTLVFNKVPGGTVCSIDSDGDVTAVGDVSANNVTATTKVSAPTLESTGAVTAQTVQASGGLTAQTVQSSGDITAQANVNVTGNIIAQANMQITRGDAGPGLRLIYDGASDLTRDLFIGSDGTFKFVNVDTTSNLMLLDSSGNLSVTGKLNIGNLPTSATGLSTGDLYNDGGTVKVAS